METELPTKSSTDSFHRKQAEPATLAFLPLGTGNSFLRDFSDRGVEFAIEALLARRSLPCDVLRLTHQGGVLHYINLLSMGFSADVATLASPPFQRMGRDWLPVIDFHQPGAFPAASVSPAGGWSQRKSTAVRVSS